MHDEPAPKRDHTMQLDATQILIRPLITEKSNLLREHKNQYVFEVHTAATKKTVAEAVERLFAVDVQGVRITVSHGKTKRVGRFVGQRAGIKKAYVHVAEGQQIDFFQEV